MTAAEVFPSVNTFINNVSILIFGPASIKYFLFVCMKPRVSEPEPPRAGVFGWSRRRHFGPAPAPP